MKAIKKYNKIESYVNRIAFYIPRHNIDFIVDRASLTWNIKQIQKQSTKYKVCVDYIRHKYTPYDMVLKYFNGNGYARLMLSDRIFPKIAEIYPELKEECIRQMQTRIKV